jgi:hypothetical protein
MGKRQKSSSALWLSGESDAGLYSATLPLLFESINKKQNIINGHKRN